MAGGAADGGGEVGWRGQFAVAALGVLGGALFAVEVVGGVFEFYEALEDVGDEAVGAAAVFGAEVHESGRAFGALFAGRPTAVNTRLMAFNALLRDWVEKVLRNAALAGLGGFCLA